MCDDRRIFFVVSRVVVYNNEWTVIESTHTAIKLFTNAILLSLGIRNHQLFHQLRAVIEISRCGIMAQDEGVFLQQRLLT
jgi:hypothetical protein